MASAADYEAARVERLARNAALLNSLDISGAAERLSSTVRASAPTRKRPSRRGLKGPPPKIPPTRVSLRQRGKGPAGEDVGQEEQPVFAAYLPDVSVTPSRPAGRVPPVQEGGGVEGGFRFLRGLVDEPYSLEDFPAFVGLVAAADAQSDGEQGTGGEGESAASSPQVSDANRTGAEALDAWASAEPGPRSPVRWAVREGVGTSADAAVERAKAMQICPDWVAKVTPDRTYSIACLPRPVARPVIAVGDKQGRVGLWDVDAGDSGEGGVHVFRPHVRPVTALVPDPVDAARLWSVSYDGSVRCLDLCRLAWDEVVVEEEDEAKGYFTHMDVSDDGASLAVSKGNGQVLLVDARSGAISHTLQAHDRKLNTVFWRPGAAERGLVTASLDRTVRVWDPRAGGRGRKDKPVAEMEHGKSVCGARWSPDGSSLVSLGLDDVVRVWGGDVGARPELVGTVKHNNQTGRWLTKFQPAFDPKHPSVFVTGAMRHPRAVDWFHAPSATQVASLHDGGTCQSSVTSLHAFHPTLDIVAGSNSSGRVFVWRADRSPP